ncbi:MAG TPA: hypothetical protein VN238_13400 [Solirubrobacteraceae bacterium]|nr:hypothetical protein [Solirubrobacteraceae bacterium]
MPVKEIHESAFQSQRWFAGKRRAFAAAVEADAFLDGRLVLADVSYADGGEERYLLIDEGAPLWGALLRALARGPVQGRAGALTLRAGPAFRWLQPDSARESTPSTDQSNTLVALDDRLLVKAYRRLHAGPHPEVELCAALATTTAPVPAYAGAIWHVAPDGTETAIALLQELVLGAESGWEAPILRAVDWLRAPVAAADPSDEYRAAGAAAASLHAALAHAFPGAAAVAETGPAWEADALALLDAATRVEPYTAAVAGTVRERLAALRDAAGLPLTRIHGDLHVAQLLRTADQLLIVDFEGDPTRPLADRRRPDTPLRDLACLLRSVDHVGHAAARRCSLDPEPWIARATAAVLEGYGAVEASPALLHALELAKECQELVYAASVVPEWLYAPRAGLRRLIANPPTPES